jgi:hypothetical protein
MMKFSMTAIAMMISAGSALAAESSCDVQATEKKIYGAAKASFMTKCKRDMEAFCDTQAAEKKIFGAAKASFTKKCVKDGVGM